MFCTECGFALLEESAFCSRCGVRTEAPSQQRGWQSPPREKRSHVLGTLVGTVVVVGAALAAAVGLTGAMTQRPEAQPISWSPRLGPAFDYSSPAGILRQMEAYEAAQQANRINAALQQANMPRIHP